jgi:hypothetical protein
MNMIFEKVVNAELLDSELRDVVGSSFLGISTTGEEVTVHFSKDLTGAQKSRVQEIVGAHDAQRLTLAQQADAERISQRAVFQTEPLSIREFDTLTLPVKKLAERVAWLEQEVIRMVGSEGGRI